MKLALPASAFEKKLLAIFCGGAFALLMLGGLTWYFARQSAEATRFVMHTQDVIASIDRLQLSIYRAESEQRGYLIAGGAAYLAGYRQTLEVLSAELSRLSQLVSDNPQQTARVTDMRFLVNERIALLNANAARVNPRTLSRSMPDLAAGTAIDRRIDALALQMHVEEQRLLGKRQQVEAARAQASAIGFGALLLLVLLAVPLLYWHLRAIFREKQAVSEEARRLVAVIDGTPDLIAMSTPDGHVSYVNRAARRLLELGDLPATAITREMAYTRETLDIITRIGIPAAIANGSWTGETTWLTQSGREIPVSQVLIAHRQTDGSLTLSTIARDISDRKAAERLLAEQSRQVEQASRMKTEFMATMSHELRTPLNAIIGFSSVIRDGLAGPVEPAVREYAQDILASGRHLLALINDILDLSTIESGNMRLEVGLVDADELVASGMAIVREPALSRGIRLEQSIDPDLQALEIDPRKTRQIIFNLVSNAVKFTSDGGTVRVAMRKVPRCSVDSLQAGCGRRLFPLPPSPFEDFLEITVADTGIGIAAADLYRLFQPFAQLDASRNRAYEGTGLGLVMVRRLAELQQGSLMVDSVPGQGTRFCVWLPLRHPISTDPLPAPRVALTPQMDTQ